jgi:hypothetical protein
MLLEDFDNLTHFIIASQPNRPSLMDTLGNLFQYPALAIESESTSLLDEFGHGEAFVKETEFAAGGFFVGGVGENAAVQEGTMDVCDHGTDVPGISK